MNNNPLLAIMIIALKQMDNIVIAVAYNSITGFGKINKNCLAFKPMKEAALIHDDGRPADNETLLTALEIEINRRVEAGTFT